MTQKSNFIKPNLNSVLTIHKHLMKFMIFSSELFLVLLNRYFASELLNAFGIEKTNEDIREYKSNCPKIVNFFLFLPSFLVNPYVKNLIQIQKINDDVINDANDVLRESSDGVSIDGLSSRVSIDLCGGLSDCDLSFLYSMPHESIFALNKFEKYFSKCSKSGVSGLVSGVVGSMRTSVAASENFIKNVISVFNSVGLYDLNDCKDLISHKSYCENSSDESYENDGSNDSVKRFAKLHLEFFLNYVKCFDLESDFDSLAKDYVCYIENVVKLFLSNSYNCNELKQYRSFLEWFLDLDLREMESLNEGERDCLRDGDGSTGESRESFIKEKGAYVSKSMSFVSPEIESGSMIAKNFMDKEFMGRGFLNFLHDKSLNLYEMSLLKNSAEKFYLNCAFSKNGVSKKIVNFREFVIKCFESVNVANSLFINHLNNLNLSYEEKFYSIRKWKSYCAFFESAMSDSEGFLERFSENFSKKFEKCVGNNVRFVSFANSMLSSGCSENDCDSVKENLGQEISFQCFIDLVYLNESGFTANANGLSENNLEKMECAANGLRNNESVASELYFVFCDFYNNSEFYEVICSIIFNSDKFQNLIQNFSVESKNCYLVVLSFASFKTYKYNLSEFSKVKKIDEILRKIQSMQGLGVNFDELDNVMRDR